MNVKTRCFASSWQFYARWKSFFFGGLLAAVASANVAAAEEAELLTGNNFRAAMEQPIDAVSWKGKSMRGALDRITQTQHIAVMLDRRIDPDQQIELSASSIPLERMIRGLARKYNGTACQVGPIVYIGPDQTCQLLATVTELRREEIRGLPAAKQRQLLRTSPMRWERLTSPRDLLAQLERDYRVRIEGKENMPHDLWPAMELPPVDFATKLSVVLAGFHVTFEWHERGDAVRIVAMPQTASLQREYESIPRADYIAKILKEKYDDASIKVDGNRLVVDARMEVHNAIDGLLRGETVRRPVEGGTKVYTLNVENKPAGGVARALGAHVGKEVVFDVKVKRRLTKEVTFSVENATLSELLSNALSPVGLKFEINGDTIRVFD